MKKILMRSLSFVMLALMAFGIATNLGQAHSSPAEDHAGEASDRIQVVLTADGAPAPGGTAYLTFSATPLVSTPDLVVEWFLPAGVTLQGQPKETLGSQTAGQTVKTEGTLKFAAPGTYKVAVSASFHPSSSMTFSTAGVLFFVIDQQNSYVTDQNPDAHRPVTHGLPEKVTVSPSSTLAPDEDGCFTVSGRFTRTNLPVTDTGYDLGVVVPVIDAVVDIREEDLVFDDSYGTVLTDSQGNYSKSFCDDDGLFDDTLEIYVRLISERHNNGQVVYVEDSSYIDEKYEYNTEVTESTGGAITYDLELDYDWSGIFNIIDAASLARNYWVESGNSYDEDVEIHWEDGYGDTISHFYGYGIYELTIADDPSDPDQWDDSVIIHEFGHSADDYYSCDDNPGGEHSGTAILEDNELSWSEGYPDYYQSAVRAAYGYAFANDYIDVKGNGSVRLLNLETFNVDYPDVVSTYNEMAIAATLWDFNDTVNDGQDMVSYGHEIIQAVYTSDEFMDVAYGFFDDTCNFDTYMRGWIDAGYPHDAQTAAVVMQNVNYTLPASTLLTTSNSDLPEQVNTSATSQQIY
ncbi:MAG TPA: hypothetical protein PK530_10985, partial [Anaerolineales bacterium]|nr:hypothetical protein [Anaerolineales bacterium]